MTEISRDDLKAKIDRNERFVLIEVLPEESYRKVHLPGARNVPASLVRARSEEIIPDRDTEVVVYCASPT